MPSIFSDASTIHTPEPEICVHQLFEAQVKRTPHAVALLEGEQKITYAELNSQTNRLARYLQHQGVGPETIVACSVGQSTAFVRCMLAILKAGGAYLLLGSHLSKDRMRSFLQTAEPVLLLADAPLSLGTTGTNVKSILLGQAEQLANTYAHSNVMLSGQPPRAAYFAFTSGATGEPKGVIVDHSTVVNYVFDFIKRFRLQEGDRIPLISPISSGVTTTEVIPTLTVGGTLIASGVNGADMPALTEEILFRESTVLHMPVVLWHQWVTYLRTSSVEVPPSLRLVVVSGDKVFTKHFQDWRSLEGAHRVDWVAAYGTTETAVVNSFYTTAATDDLSREPVVPIGKPIANTVFYILDETGRRLGPGKVGELHVAGSCLARGYFRQDEATRARFVPDPFSHGPGARIYKTGDQARAWSDGTIVCLGRKNLQVELNGIAIDLGEIELVLMEHGAVDEAAVVVRKDETRPDQDVLVAFVTTRSGRPLYPEGVLDFAATRLHRRLMPQSIQCLAQLPRTANGKLDRAALEA